MNEAEQSPYPQSNVIQFTVNPKTKVQVTVALNYAAVRWVNGITMLNKRPISVTTTMRRLE